MEIRLPVEIVENILRHESLSIGDVLNFAFTNHYYYDMVKSNKRIWMKVFFKTWPQFSHLIEGYKNCLNYDWYGEVKYVHHVKQRIREIIRDMSSRFYKLQKLEDSDFVEWSELYQQTSWTYYYLVDDLMNIVNTNVTIHTIEVVPITTAGNRTFQYYAMESLKFLRKMHTLMEWHVYITLSRKMQTLEKGAAIMLQWCQPDIDLSWKKFALKLDEIAGKVKINLYVNYPDHPLMSAVPKEQFQVWRNENIKESEGNMYCLQTAKVVNHFYIGFLPVTDRNYRQKILHHPTREFVEVAETEEGANVIFSIERESVARRLGIKYEPLVVRLANHGVRHTLEYPFYDEVDAQYYRFASILPCFATPYYLERLAYNLHESCWRQINAGRQPTVWCVCFELLQLLDIWNLGKRYVEKSGVDQNVIDSKSLMQIFLRQRKHVPLTDYKKLVTGITNTLQQYNADKNRDGEDALRKVEAKVRPLNLKYAVGMVMEHMSEEGPRTCVICDWKPIHSDSPVYDVLFEDGSYEDVPQDELAPSTSADVLDSLNSIGKHFSHSFNTHFVPNIDKEREYPDDTAVRHYFYYEYQQ